MQGNLIGTNAAGTPPGANGTGRARLRQSHRHRPRRSAAGDGNLSPATTPPASPRVLRHRREGNRIGTNAAGTAALLNDTFGCRGDRRGNTIGGIGAGAGNLISGNRQRRSLRRRGRDRQPLLGYTMGSTPPAPDDRQWRLRRPAFNGAGGNTIGGTTAGARNVLSGNAQDGSPASPRTAT